MQMPQQRQLKAYRAYIEYISLSHKNNSSKKKKIKKAHCIFSALKIQETKKKKIDNFQIEVPKL